MILQPSFWKRKEYADLFANPYQAAGRGFVDEVIEPRMTRRKLIRAFESLANKTEHLPKKNMETYLYKCRMKA